MDALRNILVLMEPGSETQPAFAAALALAVRFGARIELLMVDYQDLHPAYFSTPSATAQEFQDSVLSAHRQVLERLSRRAAEQGVTALGEALWGTPFHEMVLARVAATRPDLVVKHSVHHNRIERTLFTGSDWCPPCKRLEEEVFSKAEFGPEASKTFVLVKFDFPQNRELPPELVKQNEEWQAKYGVSGFPTVILVDKDQLPFGVLGFEEGGPENYLKRLEGFRQKRIRRDESFAKAAQAEGAEKAKLLDEGLAQLDEGLVRVYYESKLEEIGKLDADDALGLRTKWFAAEEAEKQKRTFIYRRPQLTNEQLRRYEAEKRPHVVRFAMPVRNYTFRDVVLDKEIPFPAEEAQEGRDAYNEKRPPDFSRFPWRP